MIVATVADGPSCRATRIAATTFAPDEVPAKIPSSLARRRAIALASSVETAWISLTSSGFQSGGTKPIPIPSILCEPDGPSRQHCRFIRLDGHDPDTLGYVSTARE